MKVKVMALLLIGALAPLLYPEGSGAEVNVNINIGAPLPRVVLAAPPAVVVIPDTYVYFVPDVEVDILFFGGFWWRPHSGRWYRASEYNGPWVFISIDNVPGVIVKLPPGYRRVPPGHERIPYGQLKEELERMGEGEEVGEEGGEEAYERGEEGA